VHKKATRADDYALHLLVEGRRRSRELWSLMEATLPHLARDGLDLALVGWQRALRHHALEVVVVELRVRQLECVERVVRRCKRPGDTFSLTQLRTAQSELSEDERQVLTFCGARCTKELGPSEASGGKTSQGLRRRAYVACPASRVYMDDCCPPHRWPCGLGSPPPQPAAAACPSVGCAHRCSGCVQAPRDPTLSLVVERVFTHHDPSHHPRLDASTKPFNGHI
jgi:hypothetical protein